jgi:DNA-directed RNA polymerase subunit RPC12/RpoP
MRKKIKRIITDKEYVTCPYCVKEGLQNIYKLKFISNNHLTKVHNITFDQLMVEYPKLPTMTKDQQEKRSKARKDSQKKINKTYEQKKVKVGFANKETAELARQTIIKTFGTDNFMKSEEGKSLFRGSNNPMSKENPASVERRKRVSASIKGKTSKLKNRSYKDIHGEEKAKKLKEQKSIYLKEKFQPDLEKSLKYLNLELLDSEYMGAHYRHKWKCIKCSTEFEQIWNALQQGYQCPKCFPRFMGDSKSERDLRDFISALGLDFHCNDKKLIYPKELDIVIPSKNCAIEMNGLYYHSEKEKEKRYHLNKTLECEAIGIQLIHIFEDEWVYKNDIVKARLKYLFNCSSAKSINGRDCIIKEISVKEKDNFLLNYHIQGTDIGSLVKLGAFYNDNLISVMTFSKLSIAKGSSPKEGFWELNRFCSDYSYIIHGIASKLLSHFKNNYEWEEIISYADRRWSNGNLYKKLGFDGGKQTSIDYWYSKGSLERIPRYKMRKKPDEPKDIPEHILRAKEGYFRIYGCGNLKFTLRKSG